MFTEQEETEIVNMLEELERESLERLEKRKSGKKNYGHFQREWTEEEVIVMKTKCDTLVDELIGTLVLNIEMSDDHVANIVYRQHFRHKVPDEVWNHLLGIVKRLRTEITTFIVTESSSSQVPSDTGDIGG